MNKKHQASRQNRRLIVQEKFKEAFSSVLPITLIVFCICFFMVPVPSSALLAFAFGAVLLVVGMAFFTLGTDLAMTPIGVHVGGAMTGSKKLWVVVLISFVVGVLITISEPDLQVLAGQVPNVPNMVLILSVAVGVGLFLVVALLRILFRVRISYLLFGFYAALFVLAQFVPTNFLSIAFDSGGVTTGPMTVPFILALGVGVSAIRSDVNAENDSFGLVALCSIGPILAVMILGLVYHPDETAYVAAAVPAADTSMELWQMFLHELPHFCQEVGVALLPIIVFFVLFQIVSLHLHKRELLRISVGMVYTYIGLVLFLLGVNVGFMPVGNYLGQQLGALPYRWILIPLGMLIGYFVVAAEPAVHVLNKQVYEITSGAIPKKALSISLSIGVSVSVGLAMFRVLTGLPILALLIPGYLIAIVLMLFSPEIFTSIAFDSGGVASGPMTATFLLPLTIGACISTGGNINSDAFGTVAMVAMTPLITIQILGVIYKYKQRGAHTPEALPPEADREDIIDV